MTYITDLLTTIDLCGMLVIIDPADLSKLSRMGSDSCRGHYGTLGSNNAFIEVNTDGSSIVGEYTASSTETFIESLCGDLVDTFGSYDQIWFYRFFDEPAATQRGRQYNTVHPYDDYFPSYLTPDTTSFRADSAGTYSWVKWALAEEDASLITCGVFAGAQRIFPGQPWARYSHGPDVVNAHGRAEIVRGFCNMRYQPDSGAVVNNFNDLISIDIYPFRHAGTTYQDSMDYTPALGDSLHTWLLNHMENAMDSTFLAALENDCLLLYWPQAFGFAGGASMWVEYPPNSGLWTIEFDSNNYRIPTPAEFRMNINLALLRQAKGLLPYCITTYSGDIGENIPQYTTGLLGGDLIPFDAPFEEWTYTGRPQDSLSYIRPDSIEPFISGFDPLYSGPGLPPGNPGQQQRQNFLEWKFAPYGRLWNSLEDIFGAVAFMAPELAELYWYEGYEDAASIMCVDGTLEYMTPEIKVFRNTTTERSYLYYVNRNIREATDIFSIRIDARDLSFPSGYALDHSRRVIIPSETDSELFSYNDTLEAGEARLIELTPISTDADMRITPPDIFASIRSSESHVTEFAFTAGDSINIQAEVFNFGTDDVTGVVVTLSNITGVWPAIIDRDTLSFDGLSLSGYTTDSDTASFLWVPVGTGIHKLHIGVAAVSGESDTRDNSVSVPFLIRPEDYATSILDDAWDMTEGGSNDWNTDDIEAVSTYWLSTAWTDSVSGMFEGRLSTSIPGDDLRGDISLAIPSQQRYWIDTDDYSMLSFAAVSRNPNPNSSIENGCDVYVGFKDSDGTLHWSSNPLMYPHHVRNGWDEWKVYGPYDLDTSFPGSPSWSGNSAQELWLSFRAPKPDAPAIPQPVYIRVGWVKLTE